MGLGRNRSFGAGWMGWTALLLATCVLAIPRGVAGVSSPGQGDFRPQFKSDAAIIKLSESAADALTIRMENGVVLTGIPSLDSLNLQFRVTSFKPLFPESSKFSAQHRQFGLSFYYKLTFEAAVEMDSLCWIYGSDINIIDAAPNFLFNLHESRDSRQTVRSIPNDPRFQEQWYAHNIGQTGGTVDADIDLPEAWNFTASQRPVIVSLLDTGVDLEHPDLAANLWSNPDEIPGNGIDDDNNGYIDDVHGWDFSDADNDPADYHDHGTHTAGIIAAESDNGIGIAGVAGQPGQAAQIMACKIFPNAYDDVIAQAFVYAADNGALVSSNSWGGGGQSALIEDAIDYYLAISGGVVVFAAGNSNTDSPAVAYPASYDPVIAVAATDHDDRKASFSNFGDWVDLTAPGVNILSTVRFGEYELMSGTSMACPQVAGMAALLFAQFPDITGDEVRARLLANTDDVDAVNSNYAGKLGTGRLDAYRALTGGVLPAAPAQFSATTIDTHNVNLTWSDPTTYADGAALQVAHINVYRDGEKMTEIAPGVQQYLDSAIADGEHIYFLTATAADGVEGNSTAGEYAVSGSFPALIWQPMRGRTAQEVVDWAQNSRGISLASDAATALLDSDAQNAAAVQQALAASGVAALVVSDLTRYDLANFEYIFALLGQFPGNHVITANGPEARAVQDFIASGGKVYMEGGDAWFYDPQNGGHDFGPLFGIAGLEDGAGTGELNSITGDCIAKGLNFNYAGGDRYPDHLAAVGAACELHSNASPQFACGVANPEPAGARAGARTIGASFTFASLVGVAGTDKASLMARYLDFFDHGAAVSGRIAAKVLSSGDLVRNCSTDIDIVVDLSQTPQGETLGDYAATLKWDANALELAGYSAGDPPFAAPEIDTSEIANGQLTFRGTAADGAGEVIRLLTATFRGVGNPGSETGIELQVSEMRAAQSQVNLLPIVAVQNFQGILGDAFLLGDVTGDNAVTLRDALVISTYAAKLEVASEFATRIGRGCADASLDGLTSIFDALLVALFESDLSTGPYAVGVADCQAQQK